MSQILNDNEIKKFNEDGAIRLKGKFEKNWIKKLKVGISKAKANPSPRFTNHTKDRSRALQRTHSSVSFHPRILQK